MKNVINISNIDKIIVNDNDVENILKVTEGFNVEEHKENILNQFDNVVLIFNPSKESFENIKTLEKFNIEKSTLEDMELNFDNIDKPCVLIDKRNNKLYTGFYKKNGMLEHTGHKRFDELVGLSVKVLTYIYIMSMDKKNVEKYINTTYNSNKTVTMKKGKKNKNIRRVKITNTKTIRINPMSEDVKRRYQRIAESWSVRGHWRKYKNGKKIWVKPHIKGGGNISGKEYEL